MATDSKAQEEERLNAPEGEKQPSAKDKFKKELFSWLKSAVAAVIAVYLIYNFVFMMIRVDGTSMNDTLLNNERLFVTVADMKLFGPSRGDVVICHYPNRGNTFFVKRVVAVPGDQVERVDGVTYVLYTDEDGNAVREDLGRAPGSTTDYEAYTLQDDEYFVVGDNRRVSHDSRDWNDTDPSNDVGPISRSMIVGRARFVIWPLSRIRTIE